MTEKPGVQTTEFWITIMPFLLAFGVLILIGLGRADNDLLLVVLGLLGGGGSYASGQYSRSRGNVKASVIEAESARQTAIIEAETAQTQVHVGPGMNEAEVARLTRREIEGLFREMAKWTGE